MVIYQNYRGVRSMSWFSIKNPFLWLCIVLLIIGIVTATWFTLGPFDHQQENPTSAASEDPLEAETHATGRVFQVFDHAVLVELTAPDNMRGQQAFVSLAKLDRCPQLFPNDTVDFYFVGGVLESYPLQIVNVTRLEKAAAPAIDKNAITFRLGDNYENEILLNTSHIADANCEYEATMGHHVTLTLTAEGTALFQEITTRHLGQVISIWEYETLLTAPIVSAPIVNGQVAIWGYDQQAAESLAMRIHQYIGK